MEFDFPVQIKPSRRKTLALVIRRGQLEVRTPLKCPAHVIDAFLMQKASWIQTKMQQDLRNYQYKPPNDYQSGSLLFYLGDAKSLHLSVGARKKLLCSGAVLSLQMKRSEELMDQAFLKRTLHTWFRKQTLQCVTELCEVWGQRMDSMPSEVTVRSYKARWGSCSRRGKLTFHDLLSMAPLKVIEYVVIHELAHLKYMDHSSDFWSWVAVHQPDYQEQVTWLRQNQYRVSL